jgi:murein DD-endopeptidase MepM/ murein hydrolase activator NlpD
MTAAASTQASIGIVSPVKDEHVRPVPGGAAPRTQITRMEPAPTTALVARWHAATAATPLNNPGGAPNAFLTRPYPIWHTITSVFDHCNPDYTVDTKVCEFDGSLGLKSNGVDPSFPLGYAQTRGGSDYLYYDGHNGWDYALNYENVMAAADGTVKLAGLDTINPCFGQTVIIDHPGGFSTRYSHLSQIYVTAGQSVSRTQVIAQSGNTGCSSGPHLHFGVYITSSWTAVDPWGWSGAGADPWPSDQGNLWLTGYAQFPIPWAPTNVTATAGNGSAAVSWTASAFDGGTGITGYTVTSSPDGLTASVAGNAITATVTGLARNTSYTFTVTASNNVGKSPASTPSTAVSWTSPTVVGYSMVGSDGSVSTLGGAVSAGSLAGQHLNAPIVAAAATATRAGYWMAASDGGVFTFGDAHFFGSVGGQHLNAPVVGIAPTPDGLGYWLVAADGGVFSFGSAHFYGSMGAIRLNKPVVSISSSLDGQGYWLTASDGGIFTFGDAKFLGSTGSIRLNKPVVAMAPAKDGAGYWLVASDGGIFTFGSALFYGSEGGQALTAPIVNMTVTPDGGGYWLTAADGGVFTLGDAPSFGSLGGKPISAPIIGLLVY